MCLVVYNYSASDKGCFSLNCIVMQGCVTLQLTRDPGYSRGFLSARSVTGFLSDVCRSAADEVGKIHLIADERVS